MLREESGTVRVAEPDQRQARHGRPKPIGARFRLPGFRFSGAAMAMSTVVGISVATTWLVSQQQNVGRPPGLINVGASPPAPSPDAVPQQAASSSAAPSATATSPTTPGPAVKTGTPAAKPSQPPARPVTAGPTPSRSSAPPSPATGAPVGPPASPSPSESGSESAVPSAGPSLGPPTGHGPSQPPIAAAQPAGGVPADSVPAAKSPEVLTGLAECRPLGLSGTRHTLELTVVTPITALQVEFRLERPTALPGTLPWSNLPGTVVTVLQERGTVIYRFTLTPGLDVEPGAYVFAVHGATSPLDPLAARPSLAPEETWTASAFSLLDEPRAVAVRGLFG
ncbi:MULTISPECIES: hypothetical protein [unclassified Kitasatospora]|uniref:hypothetical protein n=1 Tax=unclassified Kitasatospora TaxID=2633591 RepID=UPI00070D74E9|nr:MULTISPECIES: hypothetical protein [unclassified Kitasatospora]KQV03348.1 hypothetical protein ASC99_16185 [Kitasatospora sp. Root107]KRB66067.1 hypothetical protein ASE03_31285 [Kitasatospora sp. Root187]